MHGMDAMRWSETGLRRVASKNVNYSYTRADESSRQNVYMKKKNIRLQSSPTYLTFRCTLRNTGTVALLSFLQLQPPKNKAKPKSSRKRHAAAESPAEDD